MALFILFFGIALIMLAWQNNQGAFAEQIGTDFSNGFLLWFGAILAIGALGYVKSLQSFTRGIMGLILLVFILKNGNGLFNQLQQAVQGHVSAQQNSPAPTINATPQQNPGGVGSIVSGIGGVI